MKRLRETNKRNSDEGGASPKRSKSKRTEQLVDFLLEQRLTSKLDKKSYVQNNLKRKVNSK